MDKEFNSSRVSHAYAHDMFTSFVFSQGEKCKFSHDTIPLTKSKVNFYYRVRQEVKIFSEQYVDTNYYSVPRLEIHFPF